MKNIQLLDCTLRDGGYVNDWRFGKRNIQTIMQKIVNAGIETIECGYLSTKDSGSEDSARYSSIGDVRRAYTSKADFQDFAVMINYGEFPIELLQKAEADDPILRVAFHKKNINDAFEYFRSLEKLGYRYFIQPMGALNYSDKEYVQLIERVNKTKAEAFYIVDSFGVMEMKDFRRLLFLADNNLKSGITLGYHAHNNLQQAYSNAKYMVEQNLEHSLIIDASVFGMGRGAGNLNLELFAKFLNDTCDKNYNIEPILEVFDECLKPIFINSFWGYSLPFYLSAIHNCHPNYASFFSKKNTLSVKSLHELLNMISDSDRNSFTKEKASNYYQQYQANYIDDKKALNQLAENFEGRKILILAPGKTILTHRKEILDFISREQPVVIGVNTASEDYHYNYLFVVNEKRFKPVCPSNVGEYIITSNIHRESELAIKLNYSSYLVQNEHVAENPTLMLLNILKALGIHYVAIAGFDGFSADPKENYFSKELSLGSNVEDKLIRNKHTKDVVEQMVTSIKMEFLTPSMYFSTGY